MSSASAASENKKTFVRFDRIQRIEHILFLISFSLLGITGLPQKFPLSPISQAFFELVGGVENARIIHHTSAIVMMIVSFVHVIEILYRLMVDRIPIAMIPWIEDAWHVWDDIQYYLGKRKHMAYYGRYSYAEKIEYLALVWGTIVMGATGFMMWNPITTVHYIPGYWVPAAKTAHGAEAVLAVLAIIIWHFYHVHLKHFNKSMFTGTLTYEEMQHEHPAELAEIESQHQREPVSPKVIRQRQLVFAPIALVITVAFLFGFYYFVAFENTAVVPAKLGETANVFAPVTPTPVTAPTPTPVPQPGALTWNDTVGSMLAAKCATCHNATSANTQLSMTSYEEFMKGGKNGSVIIPGDSANSPIIRVQSAGTHPATLTPEELAFLAKWIDAGAPEK